MSDLGSNKIINILSFLLTYQALLCIQSTIGFPTRQKDLLVCLENNTTKITRNCFVKSATRPARNMLVQMVE